MFMDEGMDTGDILLKAEVKIEDEDTSESLYFKLSNFSIGWCKKSPLQITPSTQL